MASGKGKGRLVPDVSIESHQQPQGSAARTLRARSKNSHSAPSSSRVVQHSEHMADQPSIIFAMHPSGAKEATFPEHGGVTDENMTSCIHSFVVSHLDHFPLGDPPENSEIREGMAEGAGQNLLSKLQWTAPDAASAQSVHSMLNAVIPLFSFKKFDESTTHPLFSMKIYLNGSERLAVQKGADFNCADMEMLHPSITAAIEEIAESLNSVEEEGDDVDAVRHALNEGIFAVEHTYLRLCLGKPPPLYEKRIEALYLPHLKFSDVCVVVTLMEIFFNTYLPARFALDSMQGDRKRLADEKGIDPVVWLKTEIAAAMLLELSNLHQSTVSHGPWQLGDMPRLVLAEAGTESLSDLYHRNINNVPFIRLSQDNVDAMRLARDGLPPLAQTFLDRVLADHEGGVWRPSAPDFISEDDHGKTSFDELFATIMSSKYGFAQKSFFPVPSASSAVSSGDGYSDSQLSRVPVWLKNAQGLVDAAALRRYIPHLIWAALRAMAIFSTGQTFDQKRLTLNASCFQTNGGAEAFSYCCLAFGGMFAFNNEAREGRDRWDWVKIGPVEIPPTLSVDMILYIRSFVGTLGLALFVPYQKADQGPVQFCWANWEHDPCFMRGFFSCFLELAHAGPSESSNWHISRWFTSDLNEANQVKRLGELYSGVKAFLTTNGLGAPVPAASRKYMAQLRTILSSHNSWAPDIIMASLQAIKLRSSDEGKMYSWILNHFGDSISRTDSKNSINVCRNLLVSLFTEALIRACVLWVIIQNNADLENLYHVNVRDMFNNTCFNTAFKRSKNFLADADLRTDSAFIRKTVKAMDSLVVADAPHHLKDYDGMRSALSAFYN